MEMIKRQNESLEFEKKKADWNLEKKKMLDDIFEEKKKIEILKISIETQKHTINEREAELENKKVMFDAKSRAELEAIEKRAEAQKIEEMALLKQKTDFSIEKQKFDSDKARLLADRSIFENTKSSFEKQLNDAMMAYEQAELDREEAKEYYDDAEKIKELIVEQRNKISNEFQYLQKMKKNFYTERLQIAQERRKLEEEKRNLNDYIYNNSKMNDIKNENINTSIDNKDNNEYHVNQSDSSDTKALFDDSVINEIIANNSENITTYKLKIDNILKTERKSTYKPNSFKSSRNYKPSNDYSTYTKNNFMTFDDNLLNEPLCIPNII